MNFYSTNDTSLRVNLKEAVLNSLPKDRGLYMPVSIEKLPGSFWENFDEMSFPELATKIGQQLLEGSLSDRELEEIAVESINFEAPLVPLDEDIQILELFHGPTLAFKDFGARYMARLMSILNQDQEETLTILVATSGDTGGAVASGFFNAPHINVIILYPKGRVSFLQEKQLTTLGENIKAVEVDGSFDDCQAMVKQAFLDKELNQVYSLSSANSINIARLIPQSFYYFRAFQQINDRSRPIVFCVPSGNFGNLTAGLLASRLGLPIDHFLAATNINDVVPSYLLSGNFEPRPSLATLSNAMDVGNPSNFMRMLDLFGGNWEQMKEMISGFAYSDEQTLEAIKKVRDNHGYILDPHAAVGYLAAKEYLKEQDAQVVVLGTAHPAKFPDAILAAIQTEADIPERLASLAKKEKTAHAMSSSFEEFKAWMLEGKEKK